MKSLKSNMILKKREKKERKGLSQGGVWFLFLMKSPKSNGILEKRVKKEQEYVRIYAIADEPLFTRLLCDRGHKLWRRAPLAADGFDDAVFVHP